MNNTNTNYNKKRLFMEVTLLTLVLAAILAGVLVPKKKNNNTNNSSSNSKPNSGENYQEKDVQFIESTDGLFDVKLPLFNPDNFGVYQDASQASKDFDLMAKVVLNSVVERYRGVTYFSHGTGGRMAGEYCVAYGTPGAAPVAAPGAAPVAAPAAATVAAPVGQNAAFVGDASNAKDIGDDVQGWETNNQKEFVDRADIAKSDGKFLFVAFEDTIMVLRANKAQDGQNQIVTQLKMPKIPYEEPQPCYETTTCDKQGECTTCNCNGSCHVSATGGSTKSSSGRVTEAVAAPARNFTMRTTKSMPSSPRAKASIEAMLLAENRLLLVVSGYGYQIQQARTTPTCIKDYLSTQIRLYNTENLNTTGELELIGVQDIHGSFKEAYMINNVVHFVTMASVNTYEYLVSPIQPCNQQYIGLDDNAYKAAVYDISSSIFDKFATCLVDELSVTTGVFPTVARMAVMANNVRDDVSNALILPDNFGSSVASITSLNIVACALQTETRSGLDKEPRLQVHQTFQMMDSWLGWSYSATDMIIIAAQGYGWNPDGGFMQQATYLFGFLLDDVLTMPYTSGMIPGTLVNEFALDYEDGVFRAATTSRIHFGDPASVTENNVYSLIPNENHELEVSGKAKIGLDNEQIFAVRFFKKMAYAVTFELTDPLYVISFDKPLTPTVIGEVKVTGFSRYLHSVNSDDTMLIGIGRDADSQGVVGGMQISLFDATDPKNPKLVTSYVLDEAYSSADREEKSFRYVSLVEGEGTGRGILIVPMNKWSDESTYFDGFRVFTVSFNNAADTGSIDPLYDIPHVKDTSMCYMCAYLQERSFVVNGDLITMKGRSVRSHELDDGKLVWMVDLSGDGKNCCQWWY